MGRPELTAELLRSWPLPEPGSDKHSRGTVLVVGGSATTPGAPLLAGLAALRAGAGRLQVATSPVTAPALGVALPEAMVVGTDDLAGVELHGVDAVLLGPGLTDGLPELLAGLLPRLEDRALVLDAGALGVLDGPAPGAVLTPNLHELEHLGGDAATVARERQAVVVTHGCVAAPDGRVWQDRTGCPALATSGSGDVLAGVVVGLLARGCTPEQAGCWGAWLHGTAGELLADQRGPVSGIARELLDLLPAAFAHV